MCGIVGACQAGLHDTVITRALEILRHRGPDDVGQYSDDIVQLGMCRLSIIDILGGKQPITNEDNSVVVVFNGEIYNYRELRSDLQKRGHHFKTDSDTEVLVHLWEEVGKEMCLRLRGMYAFAIWDKQKRHLFLARDRFGKKPLYFAQTPNGGLIFASEIKGLLPLYGATGCRREIRVQGIYDYLSLGYVPQPETIYKNIGALPMSTWLLYDGKFTKTGCYWSATYSSNKTINYQEAKERVREKLSASVRMRLRSDVPMGIFLSGGIDSSIIAYEASRVVSNLRSFTVAMEDEEYDESQIALRTARYLGIENTTLQLKVYPLEELRRMVYQYDQPFADSSAIATMAVSRLARKHVTVVLNGDGGDEMFAGYRRHLAARFATYLRLVPRSMSLLFARIMLSGSNIQRRTRFGFAGRFFRGLRRYPGLRYLIWTQDLLVEKDKRHVWKGAPLRPTEELVESLMPQGMSTLNAQLAADVKLNLLSDLLVKMDIATMAASLEARSPFLDDKVAEFAFGLPSDYHMNGWKTKAILRDAYAGRLPEEVNRGVKRGFEVPLKLWLDRDFRDIIKDTMGVRSAHIRRYLQDSFVDDILTNKREYRSRNYYGLLYALLMLELWLRENN